MHLPVTCRLLMAQGEEGLGNRLEGRGIEVETAEEPAEAKDKELHSSTLHVIQEFIS